MCGRAALTTTPEDLRDAFGLDETPEFTLRYNVTPSQSLAVIRVRGKLEWLRWGLVPSWAHDSAIGRKLPLARAETVCTAPAFREAIKHHRCLVAVSGFYEWQHGGRGPRTPFFIGRSDRAPFALAGVWERWISKDGEVIESCALLTVPAAPPANDIHDRMPLVLERHLWSPWLDHLVTDASTLLTVRGPELVAFPVGPHVNDPRNDDVECQRPVMPAERQLFELGGATTPSAGVRTLR